MIILIFSISFEFLCHSTVHTQVRLPTFTGTQVNWYIDTRSARSKTNLQVLLFCMLFTSDIERMFAWFDFLAF